VRAGRPPSLKRPLPSPAGARALLRHSPAALPSPKRLRGGTRSGNAR
jgi:hypothetical protein